VKHAKTAADDRHAAPTRHSLLGGMDAAGHRFDESACFQTRGYPEVMEEFGRRFTYSGKVPSVWMPSW